jgi:hypothetical protein
VAADPGATTSLSSLGCCKTRGKQRVRHRYGVVDGDGRGTGDGCAAGAYSLSELSTRAINTFLAELADRGNSARAKTIT